MKPVSSWAPWALTSAAVALALAACGGSDGPADELLPTEHEPTPPPVVLEHPAPRIAQACPLPRPAAIAIDTEAGWPITSRDDYLQASVRLDDGQDSRLLDARIKGRGNSTWTEMDKKPYKLKLDSQASLFGMSEGKEWAVLANHADKTLLRNELAFCMARVLGMPYTPESHFAELTLNGSHDGLYQLTNKVYPIEERIKADAKPDSGAPHDAADAFLLEMDLAHRKEDWIETNSGLYFNMRFKSNPEQMQRITHWMNDFEALVFDRADPQRLDKLAEIVDLRSLVDLYLVNELAANPDGWLSSMYLYRLQGGQLTFGPVWDFDQAFGPTKHNLAPEGWLHIDRHPYDNFNHYFRLLRDDPRFAQLVRERWQVLASHVPDFLLYLQASATALDAAQQRNFDRWPILDEFIFTNVIALGSFQAEVDFVLDWLQQRTAWIDANLDQMLGSNAP